jgi:hypothetical protein
MSRFQVRYAEPSCSQKEGEAMNRSEAEQVAASMREFFMAEGESPIETEGKYAASFDEAYEHLPEGAIFTRIQRDEDAAPQILALKGKALYMMAVEEADQAGPGGQPPTSCTMFQVGPGAAVVRTRSKFWTRTGPGPATRTTKWEFDFRDGPLIVIEAHFDPAHPENDGRENFAQALAAALGWELPRLEQEVSLEAA